MLIAEVIVIFLLNLMIVSEGNAAAAGVGNIAVLNNPALGPVSADHAVLISGRGCPVGGGLVDDESAEGNISNIALIRHEAFVPDIEFHALPVGIVIMEIGIDRGFLFPDFRVPLIDRKLRLPGSFKNLTLYAFVT